MEKQSFTYGSSRESLSGLVHKSPSPGKWIKLRLLYLTELAKPSTGNLATPTLPGGTYSYYYEGGSASIKWSDDWWRMCSIRIDLSIRYSLWPAYIYLASMARSASIPSPKAIVDPFDPAGWDGRNMQFGEYAALRLLIAMYLRYPLLLRCYERLVPVGMGRTKILVRIIRLTKPLNPHILTTLILTLSPYPSYLLYSYTHLYPQLALSIYLDAYTA